LKFGGVRLALVIGVVLVVVTSGCGGGSRPNTARLEGTITIDGQPLPADAHASITFMPMSAGRSAGSAVTNGRYVCQDAPMGRVKVYPSISRPTGRMITESDNRPFPEVASIIASKYASGMEVEITGDNTSQDFDLEPAAQ
jgi:hypothetical protein